jgi:hypothetical protein
MGLGVSMPGKVLHLYVNVNPSKRRISSVDSRELAALERFGIERENYAELLYARTQEIGDAAQFLGFAGMIVPSARWSGLNLMLFTDRPEPDALNVRTQEPVDWAAWRRGLERD